MYICIRVRWSDLALENRSFYMWVFTLSPRYIPSVRPLLLHFFTTQQRNDLINRSPSISPGRESRGGDILGGRNNVSQDARVKIAQRSGTGDRFHHAARCGPLLSLCSFPLLPLLRSLRVSFSVSSSSTFSFVRTPLPPCPLAADTRCSYALHIQGDCIIHNDRRRQVGRRYMVR